ncbi:hypothetical protein [Mycolicibacterium fortuitum]|uniref:WXG100 family type VII secretion target n=1 Tax=Mycolicibacterium fortuitum TaxID=1766 RepID=UPI003AAEDF3D
MNLVGADVDQLRKLARQLDASADTLRSAAKSLGSLTSDVSGWRGVDADRFRSDWSGVSIPAVNGTVDALRRGAEMIRRNADEQEQASAGGSRGFSGTGLLCTPTDTRSAPTGLSGLWSELNAISNEDGSAGYRLQRVVGDDGVTRYIVYIGGTSASEGQHPGANIPAANGIPDGKQLAALRRMIPDGAEVMLVGYSQGGMDAQNIAAQKGNGFNVTQIVTYGSPVRPDLDIPAVHLQADGDGVPTSASIVPWGPYLTNSTGSNSEAHIYHGKSDVGGYIHSTAYGGLAEKWDQAQFGSAAGISEFQGTVTRTQDLDTGGNVM